MACFTSCVTAAILCRVTGDPQPPRYHGVMISSTFADLPGHRARAMEAIASHGMHPVAQEQDGALPDTTVVESSIKKVRESSAFLVIVGRRYGQVPESADVNPDGLSLTELEYREARRLRRPIIALLMSDVHAVKPAVLATARVRLGEIDDPREEAHRLAESPNPRHQDICDLWLAIGDPHEAARHALEAYREAWADGEPYVRRFALDRARRSLEDLGVPVPDLPPYDPARDPDPDWMADVVDAIDKLERWDD